MKTNIIISDRNAIGYFCLLNEAQAKKVLFAIGLLKGDQRLSESDVPEARHIAGFYDGVIQATFAKELAKKFAEEYTKKHPGALLTKKQAQEYTEVNHRKLLDALGHHGLDYVLTVLRAGKAHVANPANGIEEKHMLNALRWVERREDQDKEKSNIHHRKKGLELLGFGDMANLLWEHSFVIANLYEQVTPVVKCEENEEDLDRPMLVGREKPSSQTPMEMLMHFIEKQGLVKLYIGTKAVCVPEGYEAEELVEGSMICTLAKKGLLKDSQAVLNYIADRKYFDEIHCEVELEFTEAEKAAIRKHYLFLAKLFDEVNNW